MNLVERVMIICKRPAPPEDHLQKVGGGGGKNDKGDNDNNKNNMGGSPW